MGPRVLLPLLLLLLLGMGSSSVEGSRELQRRAAFQSRRARSLSALTTTLPQLTTTTITSAEATLPGIQVAARQRLFDYAAQQGLAVLVQKITDLTIPEVTKTFHLPLAGDFDLRIYDIKIKDFAAPSEGARLVILDKFFNLWVEGVGCHVSFNWHWEKPGTGLQGTGDGELILNNGIINYVFSMAKGDESSTPMVDIKLADSFFESTEVKLHSFSADWLYQAVLSLFNDRINAAINRAIGHALSDDVPSALNQVLASLPTHVHIKGLPFATAFDYSIYTLSYVLFKGFGEVEVPASSEQSQAAARKLRSSSHSRHHTHHHHHHRQRALAASQLQRCPFAASELPVGSESLALDPHMTSLYVHESVLNCMAWGLFSVGSLKYSVVDGSIPKLHLTTDLMAMLIPKLPKTYPHQLMKIDAEALAAPKVSFKPSGVTLDAAYRTTIYVDNQTLGVPLVAQLDATLSITAEVNWDSTVILSAEVHHTLVQSSMEVPTAQWDTTVQWFIQNYAGLYPLQFLVEHFVSTPVTSLVALVNAKGAALDGWFALSGDVQLRSPAAVAAAA